MFNCGICGNTTNPRVKKQRVVVIAQRLGKGWKIVKEEDACPPCASKFVGPKWL